MTDKDSDDLLKELKELRSELESSRKERSQLYNAFTWIGRLAIALIVLIVFLIVARIVGWILHNFILIGMVTVATLVLIWFVRRKKR